MDHTWIIRGSCKDPMFQDLPRTEKNHFKLSFQTVFVFPDREKLLVGFPYGKEPFVSFTSTFAKNMNHARGSSRPLWELGQLFKNVPRSGVWHWLLVCISEANAPKIETVLWEKSFLAHFVTWKPKWVVVEKWPSTKSSRRALITPFDFFDIFKNYIYFIKFIEKSSIWAQRRLCSFNRLEVMAIRTLKVSLENE